MESVFVDSYNFIFDQGVNFMRNLKQPKASAGLFLGHGTSPLFPARQKEVILSSNERLKHIYVIGGTGTGKTKFLEGLIRQDILMGSGFGIIDPHGDLIESTIGSIADTLNERGGCTKSVKQLLESLILVDLSDENYSIGFNPLEVINGNLAYQLILELVEVFRKIWEDSWGPRMEEVLRNSFYTLAESNLTLLELPRLLTDSLFRTTLAERLTNPEVTDYWLTRFNAISDKMKIQYFEPVANKLSAFIADPFIRAMLAQQKSALNFRQIMDEGKILLINLSKGKFKENAFLIGALFLAKIEMAALSRQEIPASARLPWYLYIDEFQNFATDTFEVILSEARKYGLGLIMAHQNLAALKRKLRESILGNAYTQVYFRLSRSDANELSGEMSVDGKQLLVKDLIDQKTGEAFVKIKTQPPLKMRTIRIEKHRSKPDAVKALKQTLMQSYCKPRKEIEKEIRLRKARIDRILKPQAKGGNACEPRDDKQPERKFSLPAKGLQEIE